MPYVGVGVRRTSSVTGSDIEASAGASSLGNNIRSIGSDSAHRSPGLQTADLCARSAHMNNAITISYTTTIDEPVEVCCFDFYLV